MAYLVPMESLNILDLYYAKTASNRALVLNAFLAILEAQIFKMFWGSMPPDQLTKSVTAAQDI